MGTDALRRPGPGRPEDWFLGKAERDNSTTRVDAQHAGGQAWSTGNTVRPLIHGATYFAELFERLEATGPGDLVLFTDWRGDAGERMTGQPGSEVAAVLARADERGADVRGLVWRSHSDKLAFSAQENRKLGEVLREAGAQVLLDMRVRAGGCHHQKFVVIRHGADPTRDIAYVGGIDLCRTRRDDARHDGDPQALKMARAYGPTPAWHDAQVAITGPAVHDVETVFREQWEDPSPLRLHPLRDLRDRLSGLDTRPEPLAAQRPPPPPAPGGTHAVQLLRTYPSLRHRRDYPFAVGGERSVARGYTKVVAKARRLIYVEDQYLWSHTIAGTFDRALREQPGLHVVAVLPLVPDQDGLLSRVPQLLGRMRAMTRMSEAGGDRFAAYGIENRRGAPVYVHAKVCVVDDLWASVGSDNFNRRSWTHDSELSAAVMDQTGAPGLSYAARLRLTLAAEHLDRDVRGTDDDALLAAMADCIDPKGMVAAYREGAARLQAWHEHGQRGQRPPGRLRPLSIPHLSRLERVVSKGFYEGLVDPDGRPRSLRRNGRY